MKMSRQGVCAQLQLLPTATKVLPGHVTKPRPIAADKKYVTEWMLNMRAKYTTGLHGYSNLDVSRKKVSKVSSVEMKQRIDQKIVQPREKDLELSEKKVLLGNGHVDTDSLKMGRVSVVVWMLVSELLLVKQSVLGYLHNKDKWD